MNKETQFLQKNPTCMYLFFHVFILYCMGLHDGFLASAIFLSLFDSSNPLCLM
jgi:hypothetical protein